VIERPARAFATRRKAWQVHNRIEALVTGALHFPNDRQHVGGETLHSDLPGGGHTLRRQQGPLCDGPGAPRPSLGYSTFAELAGWETIRERGSSLGFSQNTAFANPPNVRAFACVRLQMVWDKSELFRDGGSGSFGFEIRRLSTDVSIVAV
jgi:hypothetical protein